MASIGRNEPCPCGSGKKYKRCCALADEARARAANAAQVAAAEATEDGPGQPDTAGLEEQGPGGFAGMLAAYAEPLLAVSDGSEEQVERAFALAGLFFNASLIPDEAQRKALLEDMASQAAPDEEARREFFDLAEFMLERHRTMFGGMFDPNAKARKLIEQ